MGDEAGNDIADKICELLKSKSELNIIFAAAPSQNETLASAQAYTDQQIAAIANAEMIEDQINNLNQAITDKADKNYETWMFTLADGTVIEKQVLINA